MPAHVACSRCTAARGGELPPTAWVRQASGCTTHSCSTNVLGPFQHLQPCGLCIMYHGAAKSGRTGSPQWHHTCQTVLLGTAPLVLSDLATQWRHNVSQQHSMLTSEASYREFMAATTVGTPTSHVVASLSFVTRKRNCWTRGASAAGSSAFRSSRPPCRTVNTSSPSVTELVKAMPSTRNSGSWEAFPG